jgi:hypothetical protein
MPPQELESSASKESLVAGEIDPTGGRKHALDAFLEFKLQEGFQVETHTDTHAIVVAKKSFLSRMRVRGANRYVVSVDENGEVTMIPAEPKRS